MDSTSVTGDCNGMVLDSDQDVYLSGCASFLRAVLGDDNWSRWNDLRRQCQAPDLHTFVSWLLTAGQVQLEQQDDTAVTMDQQQTQPEPEPDPLLLPGYTDVQQGPLDVISGKRSATGSEDFHFNEDDDDDDYPIACDIPDVKVAHLNYADEMVLRRTNHGTGPPVESSSTICQLTFGSDVAPNSMYCEACPIYLNFKNNMSGVRAHVEKVHPRDTCRVSCYKCGVSTEDLARFFSTHRRACPAGRGGRGSRLSCQYCGKCLASRRSLREHVATQHEMTEPMYKCDRCGLRITRAGALSAHRKKCQVPPAPTAASPTGECIDQ